jgi:hypothetical protein
MILHLIPVRRSQPMPIKRRPDPTRAEPATRSVADPLRGGTQWRASSAWRAAFLRPPPALTTAKYMPGRGWFGIEGPRITFRTIPARLHAWLRRIDDWIAYANSVVAE